MLRTLFDYQLELFEHMLALYVLIELYEEEARLLEEHITKHFLAREGSRLEARAMLRHIEDGIELGIFEEDVFPSIREFLALIADNS